MDETNNSLTQSNKTDSVAPERPDMIELNSSSSIPTTSRDPSKMLGPGPHDNIELDDILSMMLAELNSKISSGESITELQESVDKRQGYSDPGVGTRHDVLYQTSGSPLDDSAELYYHDEARDALDIPRLLAGSFELWIDLITASRPPGVEKDNLIDQAELTLGFQAWLRNLKLQAKITNLGRTAQFHNQRYDELKNIDDIDNAISFHEQALVHASPSHPVFIEIVLDLDDTLKKRYMHLKDSGDLHRAIECVSVVALNLPDEHPRMPNIMDRFGVSYMYLFQCLGNPDDINRAIGYLERATCFAREDDKFLYIYLSNLASAYQARFSGVGDTNDLNQAITLLERVVTATRHLDKFPGYLTNLGTAYARRFEGSETIEDLTRAIECLTYSIKLTPSSDPFLPSALHYLATSLERHYAHCGDPQSMDRAIQCNVQAAMLTPNGHPDWATGLSRLGASYSFRFRQLAGVDDIQNAMECLTQVISYTPYHHPDMPGYLNKLGSAHIQRFEHSGNSVDIEKAVECLQEAVQLTPEEHVDMLSHLNTLGTALNDRFTYSGDIQDNDRAVECHIKALNRAPKGRNSSRYYLFGLGTAYLSRFIRLGHVEHADQAIECLSRAATLTSDRSDRPKPLMHLSKAYMEIFQRLRQPEDLDRAIQYQIQAVELTPEGHGELPKLLSNLGSHFQCRFDYKKNLQDLDNGIVCQNRAVELASDNNAAQPVFLNNLGVAYLRRFEEIGHIDDLDTAINYLEKATILTPEDHVDRPMRLNNLGGVLALQFDALQKADILDKAIEVTTFAVSLSSAESSRHPALLYNLGQRYMSRFKHFEDSSALYHAMNCFKFSAESPLGQPETRLQAIGMYAVIVSSISLIQGLKAYQLAIDLIPELIWLGTTIDTRYKVLPQINHTIQDAVTTAIKAENYVLAFEWLEQGRSVVWNQMLQLRSPLGNLGTHHPELAERLRLIATNLYSASSTSFALSTEPSASIPYSLSPEQAALKHRSYALEYERLLSEVRMIPGFEDFMLPRARKTSEYFQAAKNNPIVVIHASPLQSRCDALALLPGDPNVHHIPLPNMTYDKAQTAGRQLENSLRLRGVRERCDPRGAKPVGQKDYFKPVLATLWTDVVKPILEALGFMSNPTKELPHITWCTTGPFSLLPIHAAGYYDRPMEKISDYVISSYTPTLTALSSITYDDLNPLSRVLAVGQEATPNKSPLPQTVNELDRIRTRASESRTDYMQLDNHNATVSNVLDALKDHSCVHLACHAYQNLTNPAESGFHLHDGTLTLRTIMQQSFHGKQLAFLSACQTAAGDDQIPDEAVHLASGMLMAGYPSVIATLWSISDYHAPLVADEVYARLMTCGTFKAGETAKALHYAVAKLREQTGDDDFISWVPYVHFGI